MPQVNIFDRDNNDALIGERTVALPLAASETIFLNGEPYLIVEAFKPLEGSGELGALYVRRPVKNNPK